MRSKFKYLFIFGGLIVIVALFVYLSFYSDSVQKRKLKEEVLYLNSLDITKDRYNLKNKTVGKYAIVEQAIKDYLDSYAVLMQETVSVKFDDKLVSILSYDNFSNDGPEFKDSFEYLSTLKEKYNSNIDNLINKLDEKNIKDFINDKINDEKYKKLYIDLMLSDSTSESLEATKATLTLDKTSVNLVIDVSANILELLKNNSDDWFIEDNEIKFRSNDLYKKYLELIGQINFDK